jgi:DNA gyrase/topoisomerase IV subunit B
VLTLVHGSMEVSIPVDRLINEIGYHLLPVLESYNWRNFDLYVTTKDTDCYKNKAMMFWQIKQVFDKLDNAFTVRRLKGLGECTAEELRHTCLDPNTRTVMTIYGIGNVKTLYDMLGEDTAERKKLVMSNMDTEWTRGEL